MPTMGNQGAGREIGDDAECFKPGGHRDLQCQVSAPIGRDKDRSVALHRCPRQMVGILVLNLVYPGTVRIVDELGMLVSLLGIPV